MNPSRLSPSLLLLLMAALLGLLHWCVLVPRGIFSAGTYFITVGFLEKLEQISWPMLSGSESGWPVPNALGFVIAFLGWFALYGLAIGALVALKNRIIHKRGAQI